MIPLHLGPLHPAEQALTLILAFGPFVLLAIAIRIRRRQDQRSGAEPTVVSDEDERAAERADGQVEGRPVNG